MHLQLATTIVGSYYHCAICNEQAPPAIELSRVYPVSTCARANHQLQKPKRRHSPFVKLCPFFWRYRLAHLLVSLSRALYVPCTHSFTRDLPFLGSAIMSPCSQPSYWSGDTVHVMPTSSCTPPPPPPPPTPKISLLTLRIQRVKFFQWADKLILHFYGWHWHTKWVVPFHRAMQSHVYDNNCYDLGYNYLLAIA